MDRNLIFQHILTKIFFKKCSKNSLQYLVDRILDRNILKKQIIQHICTILTFQYVTKQLSGLQTINVTFFILHHFPVAVLPVVSYPLCPLVPLSPRSEPGKKLLLKFFYILKYWSFNLIYTENVLICVFLVFFAMSCLCFQFICKVFFIFFLDNVLNVLCTWFPSSWMRCKDLQRICRNVLLQ
jgi:hypothetical protein